MPNPTAKKTNRFEGAVRTLRVIKADSAGDLPSQVMLVQAGSWPNSIKGELTISPDDLVAMKKNFDAGVGRPGGDDELGLPIDFSHNEWDQAAGWINGMSISDDGKSLFADPVEWSDAGKQSVLGGMFKCISPSFYPSDRGGYVDPEDFDSAAIPNTVVGAGLTNIPFFKGLSAVKANNLSESNDDDNMIYINKSESAKDIKPMTLDQVRVKAAADLDDADKKLLADHKTELSADELTKFGLTLDAPVAADDKPQISAEDQQILADIKEGKLKTVAADAPQVTADQVAKLEATAAKYEKEKAEAIIETHVKRGAIKQDSAEKWTNRLLSASETDRVELEADLKALPDNELIGATIGDDYDPAVEADTRETIAKRAVELVKAATDKGETLTIDDAMKQVLASDPDLAARDKKANKIGER